MEKGGGLSSGRLKSLIAVLSRTYLFDYIKKYFGVLPRNRLRILRGTVPCSSAVAHTAAYKKNAESVRAL